MNRQKGLEIKNMVKYPQNDVNFGDMLLNITIHLNAHMLHKSANKGDCAKLTG